jgi:mannitol-1-phosphate 5-dehydrogenase
MKALHFGAGNIGRGFIGLILQQSGFEVTFADINEKVIEELNYRKEYQVEIADTTHETFIVTGVQGIHSQKEPEKLFHAMTEADLITTAVGPSVLRYLAPTLAEGLRRRAKKTRRPLSIIACENMVRGTSKFQAFIQEHLSSEEQIALQSNTHFLDAAVDRIVPIQENEDPLFVVVEPYYEWVIETKDSFNNQLSIPQAIFVGDLQPYIERKLYTVNTGHATAAYLGYKKGYKWVAEAMKDEEILKTTKNVLNETGYILTKTYQLDEREHQKYMNKILSRFCNPYLPDDIVRIARSPIRKLQPDDRLVAPALKCLELKIDPIHLAYVIASVLKYDYKGDPEAQEMQAYIQEHGIEKAIQRYTGISENSRLFHLIRKHI